MKEDTFGWSSKKPQTMCRLLGEPDTTRTKHLIGYEKKLNKKVYQKVQKDT
jgi:hypothetical protein